MWSRHGTVASVSLSRRFLTGGSVSSRQMQSWQMLLPLIPGTKIPGWVCHSLPFFPRNYGPVPSHPAQAHHHEGQVSETALHKSIMPWGRSIVHCLVMLEVQRPKPVLPPVDAGLWKVSQLDPFLILVGVFALKGYILSIWISRTWS